jgi:hypothetical protein
MAIHQLAERIPQDSEWRTMAESAFGAVDGFRRKSADIRKNTKLSSEGHLAQIRAESEAPKAFIGDLRRQVEGERASLAKRKAHFALPQPKRDDVLGEMQRQEIRAWLRSIPNPGERIKHAASNPTIAEAAVMAPAELSGLVGDGIVRAQEFLLDHLHGPQLAKLRQEEDVIDNVSVALEVAEKQLLNEVEPVKQVAAA